MSDWLRFGFGALFIAAGILVMCCAVIGVYRYKFVLNRMHAAAMGDTLGLLLVMIGLIIINGFKFVSLKFVLVVLFFWLASPVASHLIAQLEVRTNERIGEHCDTGEEQK